jgi:hypothetical protein
MACSTIIPRLTGTIVRWIDSEYFIVLVDGKEMLGHVDYWHINQNERGR